MKNIDNKTITKPLASTNAFFSNSFIDFDLNKDIQKMYELIDDEEKKYEFENQSKLTNLRNENYKRYNNINIIKYKSVSNLFSDIVDEIVTLYNYINVKNLLTDNYEDSKNNEVILNNIYVRISRLDNMVKSSLKELTEYNDGKQKKFSIAYFKSLDLDEKLKNDLIQKYNNLVIHSSSVARDFYGEFEIQLNRKKYIDEILKLLNLEEQNKIKSLNQDRLLELNRVINLEIKKYNAAIKYLSDLIIENSKYEKEFNNFINFYNKIIAYDDTDYENTRQTYDILIEESKMRSYVSGFETLFVEERESQKSEERFIYNKAGIKNLRTSLDYIASNYIDKLSDEFKSIIGYIYDRLNSGIYDIEELEKALGLIVKQIWRESITDVHSFNPNEDYYFICSNNQFIDEKYQTILITKKELDRVNDYENYQIGFICNYDDNIMYITENNDIMSVENDDMSKLKTPLQLEQEFINFRVCNRIALNGYLTKIQAVYFINDGNMEKYMKAIDLANMYKLPLIVLKKDSQ